MTTVRQPMMLSRIKRSNFWARFRIILLVAGIAAGILAVIFFGFPLVEDLIKGVDPSLRYQPKVEASFTHEKRAYRRASNRQNYISIKNTS